MNVQPVCRLPVVLILGLALLVSACTVGPNYKKPPAPAPPSWSELAARIDSSASGGEAARARAAQELERWWQRFDDPLLAGLVRRAVAAN